MKQRLLAIIFAATAFGSTTSVNAQEILSGDTRLACEAVLCLASGTRPGECSPSLSRYFGIKHKKPTDTYRARLNFLKLCPASNQTPEMSALVYAISQGAGRCDVQSLNQALRFYGYDSYGRDIIYIRNTLPSYCAAYTNHAYTDFDNTRPRYVGIPERGGYWVEAKDYDRELAAYTERVRKEDQQRHWYWGSNN